MIVSELDPDRKVVVKDTSTVFLKNLSFKSREYHIREAFGGVGIEVLKVQIPRD